tara:strand:- start:857 stop:1270 length:414 start_codon:yes stop_codon:yes gene_type:complete
MTVSVQGWLDVSNVYERKGIGAPIRTGESVMKGKRLNGVQYGKEQLTLSQWSRKLGYHRITIKWHFDKWGHLDRLGKDYHKKRAKQYYGKTRREWYEYMVNNCAPDQKIPSIGSFGQSLRKGKKYFHRYLSKKLKVA